MDGFGSSTGIIEGTLKDALFFEFVRARILVMELRLESLGMKSMLIADYTKTISMTKFRGQKNGQKVCHYHEREGGIRWQRFQNSCWRNKV